MDIKKLAQLAQLQINEAEENSLTEEIEKVLTAFQEISEIDTDGLAPLVTPIEMENVLREDFAEGWGDREHALEQAPELQGALYRVPPSIKI